MKVWQNLFILGILVLAFVSVAAAQTEADLEQYFEGQKVGVKIDMPATKDGIDVYPEKDKPLDFDKYSKLIKANGISVRDGDQIMVTKVKVKDKHIEFQLGGGGYGTAGDETGTSTYVSSVPKSQRERDLERDIKNESDPKRQREMRRELDYLRDKREREDSRNRARAAEASEIAKARIQDKRLQGGSRFNIKFDRKLTSEDMTPQAVMAALSRYVIFRAM